MSKYKFVIVSKDDTTKLSEADFKFDESKFLVYAYINNVESLAKIYNNVLKETREKKDADFVVFVHGDASFDVKHFIEHVEECKDKYDVMGLCGTEVVNVSQSPLNWFTSSIPTPGKRWGCVTHGELGDEQTFFSKDRADVTDHEVAAIDGLCIVFGKKALESDMIFDEQFLFDQYDTDISFQTVMTYKLKLGVLVEPSLHHYSIGRSIQTIQFLVHEIDFRRKWKLGLPERSPIKQIPKAVIYQTWGNDMHKMIDFEKVEDLLSAVS